MLLKKLYIFIHACIYMLLEEIQTHTCMCVYTFICVYTYIYAAIQVYIYAPSLPNCCESC